jgi:hypothetical protein
VVQRLLGAASRKPVDACFVVVTLSLLLFASTTPVVIADGLEPSAPSYAIDNFFQWQKSDLRVLIVPPTHGPLVGPGLQPLPDGIEGALPTGTYLQATLAAIENWRYAIAVYAAENPHAAGLSAITIEEKVLAVDEVTPADVQAADIVVVYPEHGAAILGVAVNVGGLSPVGPQCVAANTLWLTAQSLSRYDMFKLAGHEFGHCLGLGHTVANDPPHDVMSNGGYPHDAYRCPSNLDLEGLMQSFAPVFGGTGGGQARVPVDSYEQYCLPEIQVA